MGRDGAQPSLVVAAQQPVSTHRRHLTAGDLRHMDGRRHGLPKAKDNFLVNIQTAAGKPNGARFCSMRARRGSGTVLRLPGRVLLHRLAMIPWSVTHLGTSPGAARPRRMQQ
jgi:hypothetical protein